MPEGSTHFIIRFLILCVGLVFLSGCKPEQLRPAHEIALAGEMVSVPGGTFKMGSLNYSGEFNALPVRTVTVRPFLLGKYEVTFAQWDACAADGGCDEQPYDEGWGRGNRPVINVSWDDAWDYIDWLNDRTGGNYRLPAEAEWEYAARAGSATLYSWGNDVGRKRANCTNLSRINVDKQDVVEVCHDRWKYTAPVGSFAANAWGLHDMHGNVWEWTQDRYHPDYEGAPDDGRAWIREGDRSRRIIRGGSWTDKAHNLRSSIRGKARRTTRWFHLGFRLARDITVSGEDGH